MMGGSCEDEPEPRAVSARDFTAPLDNVAQQPVGRVRVSKKAR
jgi:hypothetical protein